LRSLTTTIVIARSKSLGGEVEEREQRVSILLQGRDGSLRKFSLAKLRMNTIPAKNTGRHKTAVAVSAFIQIDGKKKVSSGKT
jgi:hypothetical protein